jgi:hypothetical protein
MKFEEMKKVWDAQNEKHLYVVDEERLHKDILEKKDKTSKLVNKMEWLAILANLLAGSTILVKNILDTMIIYSLVLGVLMLGMALAVFIKRLHRLKHENIFDRTVLGDLNHAIANASYQARLSYSMLLFFIPVAILVLASAFNKGKPPWVLFIIAAFFMIVMFLGRWEHRSWHVARKKRLEAMREKLME